MSNKELAQAILAYTRRSESKEQRQAIYGISLEVRSIVMEAHAIGCSEGMNRAGQIILDGMGTPAAPEATPA